MDRRSRGIVVPARLTMVRTQQTLDGIVLRTYDVGEADRLCIVFTRERGRFPARARAVRKLGSRMGALLLPGRRLTMDVRDEGKGATVVAAQLNGDIADFSKALSLATAQQGIELLLQLTEDGEPLPEVFELLFQFLHVCNVDPERSLLAFQLRLFHVLGFLPSHLGDRRFTSLSASERASVTLCSRTGDFATLCEGIDATDDLFAFVRALLAEHTRHDLKSAAVYSALMV